VDRILYDETSHNNDDDDSNSISAGLALKTKPKTVVLPFFTYVRRQSI